MDEEIQAQPGREWSEFQLNIFDAIREGGVNLLIEAVAGSGKTTTIIEGMSYADGTPLFLAFNKSIATEIGNRITRGEAKTLNALGHRIVMQNWPKSQLNANRVRDGVSQALKQFGRDDPERETGYAIGRAISLVKANGFGLEGTPPITPAVFSTCMDTYDLGIPSDLLGFAGETAYQVFSKLRADSSTFDFDDQLYLPLYHEWEFPKPPTIFVDETQDLSPIQMYMLEAMKSRVIAVGDRYQGIYAFRGASNSAMDELKKKFNMREMPLSISYRCPRAVVQAAQALCPHIQYRPNAPAGQVLRRWDQLGPDDVIGDPEWFAPGTLVLSRTNAPLFLNILRYIRARKPCIVLSNFLDSFQSWIRSFKKQYCRDLLPRIDAWYEKERNAAYERGAGKSKMAALRDKYETAKMLCAEFTTTEEMLSMLASLSTGRSGPIFSTIHKAKGLEAERVYLLRPDLVPPPWVDRESDQYQQEQNLHYVAITRAIGEFTYGVPMT